MIPSFGLLYSGVLLLLAIPAAVFYVALFGYGSRGLTVRITMPSNRVSEHEDSCVVVSVRRSSGSTLANEPELRVGCASVSWIDLRQYLKTALIRRADRIVFVEGDGSLEVADIVRVVDIARGVWPGIPVVLLTPALKKTLGGVSRSLGRNCGRVSCGKCDSGDAGGVGGPDGGSAGRVAFRVAEDRGATDRNGR